MPISKANPGPYTAGAALVGIIRRYRDKGLATPFNNEVLGRAGVPDSLGNRTMQSLQILDLIDDKGMPTPTLQKIRVVPEPEYQNCIAEWVKSAYAEVFQFIDPATDDARTIRDAFRHYEPVGQQDRMVSLFIALCAEAGLVDESKKSEPKPAARKPQLARVSLSNSVPVQRIARAKQAPTPAMQGPLPPALAGLMHSLPPPEKGWTQATRDKFVTTFATVLDYVIPVVEESPQEEDVP
jgi:hypothetical protein